MKAVKIRFLVDRMVREFGPSHPKNPVFNAGKIYEVSEESAQRWERRGAAERVAAEANKDGDKSPKVEADTPPKTDGNDGGNKPTANKPRSRKTVTRNN